MNHQKNWVVYKFGGTSMGGAEKISAVADIVLGRPDLDQLRLGVVVSAMGGVTDQLLALTTLAVARAPELPNALAALREKHLNTAAALLTESAKVEFTEKFDRDLEAVSKVLDAIGVVRECSDRLRDFVSGLGEVWSASLLSLHLKKRQIANTYVDARQILTVEPSAQGPHILWEESRERMDVVSSQPSNLLIITGFVCRTPQDVPATLGRNGSDYSASIFGHLLDALAIEIWTDVDGVMSADPRRVQDAVVIPELSYREAIELANFGAKVLHPATMLPAVMKNIPILIKNTFHPHAKGSRIEASAGNDSNFTVKGCATVDDIAVLYLETSGTLPLEWIHAKIIGLLSEAKLHVLMGTFGSPGNSLSFALTKQHGDHAYRLIQKAFPVEINSGQISLLELRRDQAILSIVSDTMAQKTGVAARFFDSLAKAGISARVINQGFSERNISVVVAKNEMTKALRSTHSGFYLSPQTISLGLIGPGLVGKDFLSELSKIKRNLKLEAKVDIRLRGIGDLNGMILDDKEIDPDTWERAFATKKTELNLSSFVAHIQSGNLPHHVLIDCSNSPEVATHYADWLACGIHVISPGTYANSGPLAYYRKLQDLTRSSQRHYLFESSICGSLPVIETLADLLQTGDEVIRLEGILSGSISQMIGRLNEGVPFSEALKEVIENDLFDESIAEDLNGLSVKRKSLLLGRELGIPAEDVDLNVEKILEISPNLSLDEILSAAKAQDKIMKAKVDEAQKHNKSLQYITTLSAEGGIRTELKARARDHVFSRVTPGETIVAFYTKRLGKQPLVVQGPGAGKQVVSAAITADLLRLTRYLGSIG